MLMLLLTHSDCKDSWFTSSNISFYVVANCKPCSIGNCYVHSATMEVLKAMHTETWVKLVYWLLWRLIVIYFLKKNGFCTVSVLFPCNDKFPTVAARKFEILWQWIVINTTAANCTYYLDYYWRKERTILSLKMSGCVFCLWADGNIASEIR